MTEHLEPWQFNEETGGKCEIINKDGSIRYGYLAVDWAFNGQDEVPEPYLTLDDGKEYSLWSCKSFRILER